MVLREGLGELRVAERHEMPDGLSGHAISGHRRQIVRLIVGEIHIVRGGRPHLKYFMSTMTQRTARTTTANSTKLMPYIIMR